MIHTNKFGIPDAIVDAVQLDPYDKGGADFSVTELIGPPQISRLWDEHRDKITVDIRDEVWRLLGQGIHEVLSRSGKGITERRLFHEFDGIDLTVSGQMDLTQGRKLIDYKVTSVYSYLMGLKEVWEAQMNLYAWLLGENGEDISEIEIHVILRDWMRSRAEQKDYPLSPVQIMSVPIWSPSYRNEFLRERIRVHTQEDTEPCSDGDRWVRGAWKHKPPKGRAKLYSTMAEAHAACLEKGGEIQSQKPTYARCEGNWCGVAEFCPQYQNEIESTTEGEST